MALSPKGQIELGYPKQDTLYWEDITGNYNASSNPGGYGAPNILKSDVIMTQLFLKAPGSDTEVLLTDWDYLPTDTVAAEITCDMYDDSDIEASEDTNECDDCDDPTLLTDCVEEAATCFVDGCWTIHYKVFWTDVINPTYDVTFNQLFYGQTLRRLHDMTKAVKSGTLPCHPNWNWERKLNDAWNDYQRMLLTSQLSNCDCACVTNALASVQKKLTELETNL